MIRDLTDAEMRELLGKRSYAHLGCQEDGKVHVIPVTYVYKEGALYTFSLEGQKIDIMRKNPSVCFQIEELIDADSWKSVIVWGEYEELKGEEKKKALDLLLDKLWKEGAQGNSVYMPFRVSAEAMEAAMSGEGAVLFRVKIVEKTGRYEQYE